MIHRPKHSRSMRISVLMPIYATPVEWVQEAVDSILAQSFQDFQLVIVDDNNPAGPLYNYLQWLDVAFLRVTLVRKFKNEGIAAALNFGLKFCSGDLVVRMDADDIAHTDLLMYHNWFFKLYPYRQVCGIQIRLFNNEREWYSHHPAEVTRKVAAGMPGHWFINHPGVCFQRDTLLKLGGYNPTPSHLAEDYSLWIKYLLNGHTLYNMEAVLMDYRVHPKSFSFAPDRKSPEWHQFLAEQKSLLDE